MKTIVDFGDDGFKIEAVISRDGDEWCCLAGENLQEGIAGFGLTAQQAVQRFKANVRNENAQFVKATCTHKASVAINANYTTHAIK